MQRMTDAEWRSYVMTGTRTAKLATTRRDGRPHVAPIWFVLDGDDLVFTTGSDSVKGRTLRDGGPVALCVDDETPPFSFVILEGEATVSEEPGELLRWATLIGGRYMGQDRAEEYGKRNGVSGEYLVRVRIGKVIAQTGISN